MAASVSLSDNDYRPHESQSVQSTALAPSRTTMVSSNRTMPSYYRRPLPDTCVALSSKEGRAIFESALRNKGLKSFFPLLEQHLTQSEPAYCGISSLVVALNAFAIDPRCTWKGPWRWYEESMLKCCIDMEKVKKTGITMFEFNCLATCQGLQTKVHYADDLTGGSLEDFRRAVQLACMESKEDGDRMDNTLVVAYSRRVLEQSGDGHFSTIAAYDAATDMVLILDTARFKYGVHWTKLSLLYEAMKPIDPDSGRSRGYILLSNPIEKHCHHPDHASGALLQSILLRSRMEQNPPRKLFKQYIQSLHRLEVTWEDIYRYWTTEGRQPHHVWSMIESQLKPCDDEIERKEAICDLLLLIRKLLPSTELMAQYISKEHLADCERDGICRSNHLRSIMMDPTDVLYILYLACIPESRRREIVYSCPDTADSTREQLLMEADSAQRALDVSDQAEPCAEAGCSCVEEND